VITREADYALRVVLALACHAAGAEVASSVIAKEMGVPYRFLRKLTKRLVAVGILHSRRGRGGGLALARTAAAISVHDVLAVMAPRAEELSPCVANPTLCVRSSLCGIHVLFAEAQVNLEAMLARVNFAELARIEVESRGTK
jgi:Rrf2 family protein